MADEEMEGLPTTGREYLEFSWWNALDELNMIIMGDSSPSDRIAASKIILEYTSSMNIGLHEPFLPKERVISEGDED